MKTSRVEPFHGLNGASAFLHHPPGDVRHAVALTHGAGSNCRTDLLVAVSGALADAGFLVLRYDLPVRRDRPAGPPRPGDAVRDREGIRTAIETVRGLAPGRVTAGGHSYGGRQTTMLAADSPQLADALLLLSYPLHPPRKPHELRTSHFPQLRTPSLFVHGARDAFGSPGEMTAAVAAIPAAVDLLIIEGAGHDLKRPADVPARIAERLLEVLKK